MADDIILPGTGEGVATDNVNGKHYQKMKITKGDGDSEVMVNPAVEEKQSVLDKYAIYATEYGATYNYICKEDKDGAWFIQRETVATSIRDYATQGIQDPAINPNTAANAWTNRATLDYGLFSINF